MHVLITGCGRKVYLITIIKSTLIKLGFENNTISIAQTDELSASALIADNFYKVSPALDSSYAKELYKLCIDNEVDLIIPTKDSELKAIADNINLFENILVLISSKNTIDICGSKTLFYNSIKNKFLTPKIYSKSNIVNIGKKMFIVKEDGLNVETSGFSFCNDLSKIDNILSHYVNPIIQEYIEGIEYTVDAIFDNNHRPIIVVPRIRRRVRANVSDVGEIVINDEIDNICNLLGSDLKLFGPTNIQLIEKYKRFHVLEVNPRISGGLQITLEGCPEYIECFLRIIFDLKCKVPKINAPLVAMKYDSIISKKI